MNKILNKLIFLFVICFLNTFLAENPDSTLYKISSNKNLIELASSKFNVDKDILSSIIFVERRENYTWEDDAMDEYLAQVGLNSSIGFCQVKMKTAYWIEVQLNDTNSIHYPGKDYYKLLNVSDTPQEIITKLQNDSINILYATAYLCIMQQRWSKANFPIDDRADILGTLYSTGLFYRNGNERKPNNNPKANRFGEMVLESIHFFNNL